MASGLAQNWQYLMRVLVGGSALVPLKPIVMNHSIFIGECKMNFVEQLKIYSHMVKYLVRQKKYDLD